MKHNDMKRNNEMRDTMFTTRRHHGFCGQLLRMLLLLMVMMTVGATGAWGQTHPYAGIWYMTNSSTYYVVPAADPKITAANHVNEDAYFSSDYSSQDGDPEKPFLTTYQTSGDLNSIWILVPVSGEGNYYYIVHAKTGKYLKYQTYLEGDNARRKFVHLETIATPSETEKFEITAYDSDVKIKPKNNTMYLNIAGGNQKRYNGGTSSPYHSGMIGGMTGTDGGSKFKLLDASSSTHLTPVISDATNNIFTITSPAAAFNTIHYTTDGSTIPNASTGTTATSGSNITVTDTWSVQAVGVFGTFITPMAGPKNLSPASCITPVITYSNGQATITTYTDNATIYYTTDDTDPSTDSTPYSSAISVSDGTTIKAIATKTGMPNSSIASLTIVLTPTISIDGVPTYNGTEQKPAITVKKGETVIDPSEYTVSYSNNINAGSSATVTIANNDGGNYYVDGSTTFTISPMSIGNGNDPVSGITIDVSESGGSYSVTVKHGESTLTQGTDYTWTGTAVGDDYEVTVTGIGNYTGTAKGILTAITPGYYALHQDGKGYLKVSGAAVSLSNDGTFQSGNLFDKGNCIWYITTEGYLQNEYFYLNVANGRTLYLDVKPVTKWKTEDISGDAHDKKHIKINVGGSDYYLCNDGSNITLSASTSAYYNACPVTVTEVENSWSAPTADNLTVQSPQLVTYLRAYFKQKIKYEFYNDKGERVASTDGKHERRVYGKLEYASGGSNKGTDWDITPSGIIYNLKASGNVDVTATYDILPADPGAKALHPTAVRKENIKYTIQQKALTVDGSKNYLLFSIKAGDNNRYPYDDGITENDPVKPDGKGGKDNTSVLTDPANTQISWKVTVDDKGFYSFQNVNTNRYLFFDDTPHTSSDYGVLCVGSTTLPAGDAANKYKFRLFKNTDTNYSTCYQIIPYSKLFVVYKNDGVATDIYAALNNNDYTGQTPKVISLFKANENSRWCIYKYETEYRIRKDFSIKVETANTASATGDFKFSSEGWYGKYINESPKTGDGQNGLVISGSYKDQANVNYLWTITGVGDYITIANGTKDNTTGTWTITTTGGTNPRKLTITVSSLPTSPVSGVIKLKLSGGEAPNVLTSANADEKSVGFTILGNGSIEFTTITSLSQITSSTGAYRLSDAAGSNYAYSSSNKPTITSFSGILDGNNQTITGLNAPLFGTLTNGTVHNLSLSGVDISQNGQVGAIASVANGGSRIYNVGILSGSVESTGTSTANNATDCCGGLVGLLDGSARVINCFSYAEIKGGNRVGGIVGYNNFQTTKNDPRTMVMNCMFYGDITGGASKAPIYNGQIITNRSDANGVSNFNYFWAGASYVQNQNINAYNCALAAETRFLQRFEFFRPLLNSNRALAAWWATGSRDNKDEMLKWVMEPSQIGTATPYPILKNFAKYPSVVNIDAANAEDFDDADKKLPRNQGRKFGTLTINIQNGSGGPTTGASITTSSVTPNITDKDPDHFNFNYYKVQLPYYNDVGSGNYTQNKVVTGWKIVTISGGTTNYSTDNDNNATTPADATASVTNGDITLTTTPYNFADRKCTDKDMYSKSGRVFNQGAYFDVPEGVTSITIEPYWAKCVFVADEYMDVVYNQGMSSSTSVTNIGDGKRYSNGKITIEGTDYDVTKTMGDAVTALNPSGTVYDNAIVLVGNVHSNSLSSEVKDKPYTIMSIDLDKDNEPDYSYILRFDSRKRVHPVRIDFLNVIGLGMAQKSFGGTGTYNFGIMQPYGWFECTNTGLFRVTQLEYDYRGKNGTDPRANSPMILQGGVIEQWVTVGGREPEHKEAYSVNYYHLGGNVWFKEFHIGVHQDKNLTGNNNNPDEYVSPHPPISVTGGDFDEFYLTGLYNTPNANYNDNAECYINGGRFGKVAGTGMQGIGGFTMSGSDKTDYSNGNIIWQIDNADIDEFYAGGINAAHISEGDIFTVISNSRVDLFCGGPKFGNMNSDKKVITNATNCTFRTFFGAGYGGNSYNRRYPDNQNNKINIDWDSWLTGAASYDYSYSRGYGGVETRIDYQFLPMSSNVDNVCRLFIDYVSFSLATTHDVTSKLTGCTITTRELGRLDLFDQCLGNFYGGGSLGKVSGPVKSTLINCTVEGDVFGAGYSASLPTVNVMNQAFQKQPHYDENLGAYLEAELPATVTYNWQHRNESIADAADDEARTTLAIDKTNHILYTNENLDKSNLGSVNGAVTLTITTSGNDGRTVIGTDGNNETGNVFGGGDESYVINTTAPANASTTVNISGNTEVKGNVFGGGNEGEVSGSATVNIQIED